MNLVNFVYYGRKMFFRVNDGAFESFMAVIERAGVTDIEIKRITQEQLDKEAEMRDMDTPCKDCYKECHPEENVVCYKEHMRKLRDEGKY